MRHKLRRIALTAVVVVIFSMLATGAMSYANPANVADATTTVSTPEGLALTPPMWFNDWNAFGCDVS